MRFFTAICSKGDRIGRIEQPKFFPQTGQWKFMQVQEDFQKLIPKVNAFFIAIGTKESGIGPSI